MSHTATMGRLKRHS